MRRSIADAKLAGTSLRTVVIMRSDWICLLLLSASSVLGAQVFRIVDADGNVTYSDRPDSPGAETIFISTSVATPAAASVATADNASAENGVTGEEGEIDASVNAGPTAEELAARRTENCGIARDRQERYSIAHRIYRNTDDGGREYLNDAEFDATRAEATADVEKWCD